MFLTKFCQQSSNFRWRFQPVLECLRRVTKIHPSLPHQDIGRSMIIGNLFLVANSVTVSYMICFDSLLQNLTDIITKCDSYFIAKSDRSLLQNASGSLLQNAAVITNCDNFITKYNVYYKLRQHSPKHFIWTGKKHLSLRKKLR